MATMRWTIRDRVAYVTLQRPAEKNSLTPAVLDDFERLLDEAEADPELRMVVLAGDGGVFCVGMDQTYLHECFTDVTGQFVPFCERYHAILRRFEAAPVLFVAAVDGLARAGGFELLIACDLVIASDRARVADHHIVFGMIPGAGAIPRAVRKLGDQRARDLLLTGRWLAGDDLVTYGVASRVVPTGDLAAAVEEVADRVRPFSGPALARMKRLVNHCADVSLSDGLAAEFAAFADYHRTEPTAADGFLAWVAR